MDFVPIFDCDRLAHMSLECRHSITMPAHLLKYDLHRFTHYTAPKIHSYGIFPSLIISIRSWKGFIMNDLNFVGVDICLNVL